MKYVYEWFCYYDKWGAYQAQYVKYNGNYWMVPNTQTNDWDALNA